MGLSSHVRRAFRTFTTLPAFLLEGLRVSFIPRKRVVVDIHGPLSQQLTQYAWGRVVADRERASLVLDSSGYKEYRRFQFLLDLFKVGGHRLRFRRHRKRVYQNVINDLDLPVVLSSAQEVLARCGPIKSQLKQELKTKVELSLGACEWISRIKREPGSCALIVPSPDFEALQKSNFRKNTFQHSGLETEHLARLGPSISSIFVMGSADWGEKLAGDHRVVHVDSAGLSELEILEIARACRFHVITPSDFSVWASWLSDHPRKAEMTL